MKKRNWLAVLIGMILLIGMICPVQAEEQLPAEIKSALTGMEITQTAYWESPGSTWFVLIRTPDRMNMLLCFELHDGNWIQSFHTSTALPQGKISVERLHITDKVQDFVYNRTWPGPILMILTDDGGYTSYQRSDSGQWNLFKVFYLDEQIHLDFDDFSQVLWLDGVERKYIEEVGAMNIMFKINGVICTPTWIRCSISPMRYLIIKHALT